MHINAIIAQFDLQTSWLLNSLENITDAESNIQFSENLNPIKWVAGHLTDTRMTILSLISENAIHEQYKKWFGKGSSNKLDDSFPTIEQIKADWNNISAQLKKALQEIPEDQLLSKAPFQLSIPDETLSGLIAYFAVHESMHIGQISVLRKLIGKEAMALGRR